MLLFLAYGAYHIVREDMPAYRAVRHRTMLFDGERSIEEEDSLPSPVCEVARSGAVRHTHVVRQLLVDVAKGGGDRHTVLHGEAKTVRLSRAVIRVLTEDDDLDLVEWAEIKGRKDVFPLRIDTSCGISLSYTLDEDAEVLLLKLRGKDPLP